MRSDPATNEYVFAPVAAATLKEMIANQIQAAVLTGDLLPGARIVESRLAKQMDVAQTTVREALQDLVNRGLLVKRVNRDTVVRKLMPNDLDQLFRVRLDLEGLAVELAHSRLDLNSLAPLHDTVEMMRRAVRVNNIPEFYRFDMQFHEQLGRLAQNEFLERALIPLSIGPMAFVLAGLTSPLQGNYLQVAEDHAEILEAFKERTAADARRFVETKLKYWHELQLKART